MKPEHTKPFDLEAAKAGAPYCCRDGQSSTILKWDGRHAGYPLIGIYGEEDATMDWAPDGRYGNSARDHLDLVMIPLGICEGKLVWWDDDLLTPTGIYRAQDLRGFSSCTWPKPALQYPRTRMTKDEITNLALSVPMDDVQIIVANAAIARAIEDGDVVPAALLEKVAIAVRNECVEKVARLDSKSGIYRIDLAAIIKAVREGKA